MTRRIALGIGILWTIAVILGLIICTPSMKPIKEGDIALFCYLKFDISLDGKERSYVFTYGQVAFEDEYIIYEFPHMHGSDLYKINTQEVNNTLPDILVLLEEKLVNDPNDWYAIGYFNWKTDTKKDTNNIESLLTTVQTTIESLKCECQNLDAAKFFGIKKYLFQERLFKTKHLWASYTFEFIFLSGLVWFILWPFIKIGKFHSFAIRAGLVPLLFFTPIYLGYASYTLTSCGPSGGILYPWIIIWFRGGHTNHWDQVMLNYTPQVLEPISQGIGFPTALTGMGLWGPIELIAIGIGLASFLLLLHLIFAKIKKKRR